MTADRSQVREAMETHDAYELGETDGAASGRVTTTVFDAAVTARPAEDWGFEFVLRVTMPTLGGAVADGDVGPAVSENWFETLQRRLEDAPKSTRTVVELSAFGLESEGDEVTVTYEYDLGDAGQGLDVAKTFAEYVEGTYVQGVVPGYEYEPPVSQLLSDAQQADGGPGGTPL